MGHFLTSLEIDTGLTGYVMVKFAVVLIHNNNTLRLRNAMTVIDTIKINLSTAQISTDSFEVYQQPEIVPVSRVELFRFTILESLLQINYFRNYLALPFKYWLPYIGGFLKSFFSLFASAQKRKSKRIESVITGKHFQSWQIGQNYDFLIVLEDDIIQTGPLDELVITAQQVLTLDKSVPLYVDLAGGYPQNKINNESQASLSLEIGTLYTNTACGYLINNHLAHYLVRYYQSHYFTSKIGIDFFLNAAFSSSKAILGYCFHLQRNGLSHGSFKGVFKSWTDQE